MAKKRHKNKKRMSHVRFETASPMENKSVVS